MTSKSEIEAQAKQLLCDSDALRIPVPLDKVAHGLNLRIQAARLGDEVSGILVIENGKGTIGYNTFHAPVRQRFTIAHEIGHYILHKTTETLFIDKQYTAVYRRDQNSSSGEHLREIQANQFAAALLMPEQLILTALNNLDFDLGDEQDLHTLAEKFQVSTQAMSLRLANLNIFSSNTSDQVNPIGAMD